jgi:hypothetical protein
MNNKIELGKVSKVGFVPNEKFQDHFRSNSLKTEKKFCSARKTSHEGLEL